MKMHISNRLFTCIGLFILFCNNLIAQTPDYKQIVNPAIFKQKLAEVSKSVNTIQCDFTQEKHLTVLSDKIISSGTFCFKKENQLRWEYTSPYKYLIIFNKDKVYIKDDHKSNQYDMGSNKAFNEINNIMTGAVQGKLLQDETKYKPLFYENNKYYLAVLSPTDKNMKDYIKSIFLYFDKKTLSLTMIKMLELSDDYTLIKFSNRKQNIVISPDKFIIK